MDSHGKKMKRGDERALLLFNDLILGMSFNVEHFLSSHLPPLDVFLILSVVAEMKTKKHEEVYHIKDWGNIMNMQFYDRADEPSTISSPPSS